MQWLENRILGLNLFFFQIEAPVYANLVTSFEYLEIANRKILNHGWVNFPLAYTQVATLSVFSYMFASLFACQYLRPTNTDLLKNELFPKLNITFATEDPYNLHTPDMIFPFFTIIEFVRYKIKNHFLNKIRVCMEKNACICT